MQHADVGDFSSTRAAGSTTSCGHRARKKVTLRDFAMTPLLYEGQSQKMYGFYFGYDLATPKTVLQNAWDTTMEFGRWVRMGLSELIHGRVGVEDVRPGRNCGPHG